MCEAKLKRIFYYLLHGRRKLIDETSLEKLLQHMEDEEGSHLLALPACRIWVKAVLLQWSEGNVSGIVTGFALRLLGLIMKDEANFQSFISDEEEVSFIRRLAGSLCPSVSELDCRNGEVNFSVLYGFLQMIKSCAQHCSGRQWILETSLWPMVLTWLADKSLYVASVAKGVTAILLNSSGTYDNSCREKILTDILSPLMLIPISERSQCPSLKISAIQEKDLRPTLLVLCREVLVGALETFDMDTGMMRSSVPRTLNLSKFNFGERLLRLVEISDVSTSALSQALILFYIATYSSNTMKETGSDDSDDTVDRFQTLCDDIISLQNILVKKGEVSILMETCELCLTWWHVVTCFAAKNDGSKRNGSCASSCTSDKNFSFQQICLYMCPFLVGWRTPQNNALDIFVTELCNISSERFLQLINDYRSFLENSNIHDSFVGSHFRSLLPFKNFSKGNAVLLFRTYICILKCYVGNEDFVELKEGKKPLTSLFGLGGTPTVPPTPNVTCALLSGLKNIMTTFQITWRDSAEAVCLLGLALDVLTTSPLDRSQLVRTVSVKLDALRLLEVCIKTYFPPDPALLTQQDPFPGFTIVQLGSTILQLIDDPHWEVRDSTLELVLSVATVAKNKYPAFQDLIEKENLCDVIGFALSDSEDYVCASGIKCLSEIILIDRFWDNQLKKKRLPTRMVILFQEDRGDMMRKEATNFILQVYKHRTIEPDALDDVLALMGKIIMSDFDWEVQVNAIRFWKVVIEKHLAEQGMIDGIFPEESGEQREGVVLTPKTLQLRLRKSLDSLSKIGCLQVLLEALSEVNDHHVITEAAEVINFLANILRNQNLLSHSPTEGVPANLQNTEHQELLQNQSSFVEQTSAACTTHLEHAKESPQDHLAASNAVVLDRNPSDTDDSKNRNQDEIIDDILNDSDTRLLAAVYRGFGAEPALPVETDLTWKKMMLNPMKPSEFLETLKHTDVDDYIAEHKMFIGKSSSSLESLLDDMLLEIGENDIHMNEDTHEEGYNIADCY